MTGLMTARASAACALAAGGIPAIPADPAATPPSPLLLDGWIEYNRVRWGVKAQRARFTPDNAAAPAATGVFYLDRRGRIWKPPTSTYLPVAFEPTPTQSRARLHRQWVAVGERLARDMRERGVVGRIVLPPDIGDVRPWQWAGFWATTRYTYLLDLPYDDRLMDPAVRRQIAKCDRSGFRSERVTALGDVFACLDESQARQGFSYGVSRSDLELARSMTGEDTLRLYVCYAPNGDPASARVVLHCPGGRAIDWLVGTRTVYLTSGATQNLLRHVLDDLHAAGALAFDFEGANLRGVAASKATWGGTLVPFYVVEAPGLVGLARHARDWARFKLRA